MLYFLVFPLSILLLKRNSTFKKQKAIIQKFSIYYIIVHNSITRFNILEVVSFNLSCIPSCKNWAVFLVIIRGTSSPLEIKN